MTALGRVRACSVWAAATMAAALAVALLAPGAAALRTGADDLETALVRCCSAALLGCAAWAWGVTTAVVAEVLRGAPRSAARTPGAVRRGVLALCGLAVAGGLVVPTAAAAGEPREHPVGVPGLAGVPGVTVLDGLPLPDRAEGAARSPGTPARPAGTTVRAGDTLWAIAERDLGPGADSPAVARRVRSLHDLNRRVIGPDPDLVHPGQQLRL